MQKKSFLDDPLTLNEKQILKKHLAHYKSLDSGSRKPRTKLEQRFILVCRGELDPKIPIEIAYLKYRRIQAAKDQKKIASNDRKKLKEWKKKVKLKKQSKQSEFLKINTMLKTESHNYLRAQENSKQEKTFIDTTNRSTVQNRNLDNDFSSLTDDQKKFVMANIHKLGSIEKVKEFYHWESKLTNFAKAMAETIFTK